MVREAATYRVSQLAASMDARGTIEVLVVELPPAVAREYAAVGDGSKFRLSEVLARYPAYRRNLNDAEDTLTSLVWSTPLLFVGVSALPTLFSKELCLRISRSRKSLPGLCL